MEGWGFARNKTREKKHYIATKKLVEREKDFFRFTNPYCNEKAWQCNFFDKAKSKGEKRKILDMRASI